MSTKPRRSVHLADLLAWTAMCLGCAVLLWWGNSNIALLGRSNAADGDSDQLLWPVSDPAAESTEGPECTPAGAWFIVDDQCRPVPVPPRPGTRNAGPCPGGAPGERSGEGASTSAASDQPTLAPPEPMELAAARQVIVVQVEADQAADGSDVRQR